MFCQDKFPKRPSTSSMSKFIAWHPPASLLHPVLLIFFHKIPLFVIVPITANLRPISSLHSRTAGSGPNISFSRNIETKWRVIQTFDDVSFNELSGFFFFLRQVNARSSQLISCSDSVSLRSICEVCACSCSWVFKFQARRVKRWVFYSCKLSDASNVYLTSNDWFELDLGQKGIFLQVSKRRLRSVLKSASLSKQENQEFWLAALEFELKTRVL